MEMQEEQINTERWWYNRTSRLYFLSTENDPCKEYRGTLVAGDFVRSSSLQVRNGVPFKPGLQEGIYFSFSNFRDEYTESETVMFDPLTRVYQIDAQKWKDSGMCLKFQDLDDSVAPHILYHKELLYTAPTMRSEELDPLFHILSELQTVRKERNRGMWWL